MQTRVFRLAATLVLVVATGSVLPAQQPITTSPVPSLSLQDILPFDAAVRRSTLANGVTVFIRHNDRPARRVVLRLAVKAGSINEADDQQGLAHLVEHVAFNGSTHFKSGEMLPYFESVGARFGPHVNAYTTFDETVYVLELPTDRREVVTRGLTALADFAGGLTLDPVEIDKERAVVIEEWRSGLGANTRIGDKQYPVIFYRSRYAERLPIGKLEVIRTAPASRVRDFYDAWYRPDRMAVIVVGDVDAGQIEEDVRSAFAPLAPRTPVPPEPNRTVPLHEELLVNVGTDPEVTQSSVSIMRKRPHEPSRRVADYRRDLVLRLVDRMIDERFSELARSPDAKFLSANAGSGAISLGVDSFTLRASAQSGKLQDALTALALEAKRVREFGFGAAELDRAKRWMAAVFERSYNERDKTESGSFAEEYLRHFLEEEPSPGIAYEHRLVDQFLPGITAAETSALARTLLTSDSRIVLAVSPEKADLRIPSETDLRAALTVAEAAAVTAWNEVPAPRALLETKPTPAAVESRRELPALGVTIVRFANGVEAWLKPTDFKNDQVVFTMTALGGTSLAPPSDFAEATLATNYVELAGIGGLKALEVRRLLTGTLASASPFVSLSTHGISGNAAPANLEMALQLLYQHFTSPNDDAEAFALLKRQVGERVANREQAPLQVFGERVGRVNASNHYTALPPTVDRVAALDRAKMTAFYRQRFSNAADFTFFMVGAFKIDDAIPLLARYVGSLPSTGRTTSRHAELSIQFPQSIQYVRVEKGREPQSQTVISFFADPPPTPVEQENVLAATSVLETALRDVLRDELSQTYAVGVGLSQRLPQRGAGFIVVQFGSAPDNGAAMTDRVLQEIARLRAEPPSADLVNRTKQAARRTYETSLRDNAYWLRRLSSIHTLGGDPHDIVTRNERIESVTPQVVQETFKRYFPLDRYTVVTLVPEAAQ